MATAKSVGRAAGAGPPASRPPGRRGRAFASLNALLKQHLRRSADGRKVVSHATINDRSEFFSRMVRELHDLGYKLADVRRLKPKHVEALMKRWEAAELSASTLQKRFSYLTLLCGWIGKKSMLRPGSTYLEDPDRYRREYAADRDRSWTGAGVDPLEKIAEIERDDPAVARVLRLQHAFGLRIQEASLLNPARDRTDETQLRVVAGTKGGRPRAVPIETDAQRAVLAEAARQAERTRRSMIPPEYDLKQWLKHCYHVLARHGVTRKDGLVGHGLRHQYANDRYEELTGEPAPVRGGGPVADADDRNARCDVTARLGHARPSITTAYYGKERPAPAATPEERQRFLQEQRVQRRLLVERLKDRIGARQNGRGPVGAGTLALRGRLLQGMLATLAKHGAPLHTPDALGESHIDLLLAHWRASPTLSPASARNQVQLLAQLCGWLDRPDLAARVRAAWKTAGASPLSHPRPWSEARIQERLQAIRDRDPRAALHLELVRVVGLTHRQAGMLQPAAAFRDGVLDVLWETPPDRVLRYPIAGARQRAVLDHALALLPAPDERVCPPGLSLPSWLARVYHVLRAVGGIGVPGEPTLADLKDPEAPTPTALPREAYLLARAGLAAPKPR
ncbi:MAG: hypothetical protein EA420_08020 [Candidatus Competibacteraceae bacterium]|nr:MAG: hypothetical protein EA420_08020 [Candidatus Competibacteraceae bacterium]